MHELSIMQSAMDQVLDQARNAGATCVHEIRLRIGALSGVVPEALQFSFEALSTGTIADGAQLKIDFIPATYWCEPCQREFSTDKFPECPACGVASAKLRSGRELELASMEIT